VTTFSKHDITARIVGVPYTVPAHNGPDVIVPGHYEQVVDVPAHDVTVLPGYHLEDATTTYSQGFEAFELFAANPDGWTNSGSGKCFVSDPSDGPYQRTGTKSLRFDVSNSDGQGTIKRTFTNLTAGRSHTFTAWVRGTSAMTYSAGVTGIGSTTPVAFPSSTDSFMATYVQVSYTFTATASIHELFFKLTYAGGTVAFADDISLVRVAPIVTNGVMKVPATYKDAAWVPAQSTAGATIPALNLDYTPLDVISGTVTMDESWSPYIQSTLVVWADPNAIEGIDPRKLTRVLVNITQRWGDENGDWNSFGYRAPVTRTFDLMLRSRERDAETGELRITLSSDESLLTDKSLVATERDQTAVNYQSSLRAVVNYALGKIGASVGAGVDTAVYVAQAPNLILNPSGRRVLTGYTALNGTLGQDAGADTYVISNGAYGQGAVGILLQTSLVGGDLEPNTYYTFSASIYGVNGPGLLYVAGTGAAADAVSPSVGPGTFIRTSVTFKTSPSGSVYLYVLNAGNISNGWIIAFRDAQLEKGRVMTPYFDGTMTSDNDYTRKWEGLQDKSKSIRTLRTPRGEDLLDWTPGMDLWDFLSPIVQATGFRLWCDESRVWRLAKEWTIQQRISISPETGVKRALDTIDRNGDWYDSVVIKYADGMVDVAGAPGTMTLVLDYTDRPYAGPFGASYVLQRALGKGRVLDIDTLSDYTTTPGMGVSVTIPETPIQTGIVSSVTWSFPDDTMSIGSRGLTDTPANAWAIAPPTRRWIDATGTWATYTN
jgi:hypothetical protein